jgi:alkaline phosphatase
MFRCVCGGLGIITAAIIADATPTALVAHTRNRDQYAPIIDSFLNSERNYLWTRTATTSSSAEEPRTSFWASYTKGKNRDDEFAKKGCNVVHTATDLKKLPNNKYALGIFMQGNMVKWVDREIYPQNLHELKNSPLNDSTDAIDQPGLKEMTIRAIDILHERSKKDKNQGWYLTFEAASIGKYRNHHSRAAADVLCRQDDARS